MSHRNIKKNLFLLVHNSEFLENLIKNYIISAESSAEWVKKLLTTSVIAKLVGVVGSNHHSGIKTTTELFFSVKTHDSESKSVQ